MIDVWSVQRYLAVGFCVPGKTTGYFVLPACQMGNTGRQLTATQPTYEAEATRS